MIRKALVDYTFSDGTSIPAGTHVTTGVLSAHRDEKNYPNPNEFDGFRFVNYNSDEDSNAQVVATSKEFLSFGHGRHAW